MPRVTYVKGVIIMIITIIIIIIIISEVQKTVLLGTARILRKVLKI